MKTPPSDTIVAPVTAKGRAGVAVLRISGPQTIFIAEKILGVLPEPRYATFLPFKIENEVIDEGIALFFKAPHSFTGEDVLELQGHGGPVVVDYLIKKILALGARFARPGEFSERAFLNNKIDLAQAEAIADLIDASSVDAMRASLRSLQGEFSKKINLCVESVIQLRLYVEASIDFVEEEIDFLGDLQVKADLQTIQQQINHILSLAKQGSLLRDGITIAIVGKPNVGKSSLLNALSGKEVAIVTDIPGTTRDVLREEIILDGMPIHVIDTAGLRETKDPIEQEGIRRARDEMSRCDLIFCMMEASESEECNLFEGISSSAKKIFIRNKIDLTKETASVIEKNNKRIISLSVKTTAGIDLLKEEIKNQVGFSNFNEGSLSARCRHVDALRRAEQHLQKSSEHLQNKVSEFLAEELRLAQLALSEITGTFTPDDLLGRIFSSFCIGK